MKRLSAGTMGAVFLWFSVRFFAVLVPVAAYRTGTHTDYAAAFQAGLIIYGGAAIGMLFLLWRGAGKWQTIGGVRVFFVSFIGAIVAVAIAVVTIGGGVHRLLTTGFMVQQSEALLPLLPILGGVLSTIVAAGMGLLWYACHGRAIQT